VLFHCNDEVSKIGCVVGRKARYIEDPESIMQIILNSANIAAEIGAPAFGYNARRPDVRVQNPLQPFNFTRIEGAFFGQIGREIPWDPQVNQFEDIDFSLSCLLKRRIIWQDSRFAATHVFMTAAGGNSAIRGVERTKWEIEYLRKKWGQYFGTGMVKTTISNHISVRRKQDLDV
jgi:hypothetical protein